ncbi:MAG: hypothetical protein JO303_19025 [Caulobacteraceae bacterium]|nr:hypothetical protein [Caulobacteraceae bacterium]
MTTADARPAQIGLARLARLVFEGADLKPLWSRLMDRATQDATDASAAMDLATLAILAGDRDGGLNLQAQTLERQRLFRRAAARPGGLRLLVLSAPGDMMANTPLDFLLEGSDVELLTLYVTQDGALPDPLPEHDLAFLAVGESEANLPILRALEPRLAAWPRPLLNADARRISELTRDGVCALLEGAPDLLAPRAERMDRQALAAHAAFPVIARPIGSHAGAGLVKLDDAAAAAAYLAEQPAEAFYLSPFVDYAGPDGLFRKQRIVLIDGRPFLCHHAVSPRWMVHYLNADMLENPGNRAEEATMMQTFDDDFARRHRTAFEALQARIGLDYFGIDCGETPDGRLLVFEADVAMIVHDMDPPDLFPYKKPQMRKVMDAFQAMLRQAAARV